MKACSLLAFVLSILLVVDSLDVTEAPQPTGGPRLEKRYKEKIVNPEYKKLQDEKQKTSSTTRTKLKPWLTTISSTRTELVTPTVFAGVTFNAKPPKTTNGMEPWVSLKKDGSPKTILPKNKNGHIKDGSPTYGTWFAQVTTIKYTKEEIKAHNMADDEVYEHEEVIYEDDPYARLNPVMRCTPDSYFKKGMGKDITSEPFCTPHDNQALKMDETYFVTWYSKFFKSDNIKIHASYLKETLRQKGMKRLNISSNDEADLDKRSSLLEKGASISEKSFFSTDWIPNSKGIYPLTIDPKWFGPKDWSRKVLLTIQPDDVDIGDLDYIKNSVVILIEKGAKVSKEHLTDLKKLEEKWRNQHLNVEIDEGPGYEKYIVMMTIPTCVCIFGLFMYLFILVNRRYIDLSHLKKRSFAGKNTTHRRIPFKTKKNLQLPRYRSDVQPKAD